MSDITIPPEALEAGARVIHDMRYGTHLYGEDDIARAACLAMLEAWPGMRVSMLFPPNGPHIILPLTEEPSDAER